MKSLLPLCLGLWSFHFVWAAPEAADNVAKHILDGLRITHGVPLLAFSDRLKTLAQTCANYHATQKTIPSDLPITPVTPVTDDTPNACPAATSAGASEVFIRFEVPPVFSPSQMYRGALWSWYRLESEYLSYAIPPVWDDRQQHAAQLIWKSATEFACAISSRTSTPPPLPAYYYVSCVFSPILNRAEYADNIKPDYI